MCHRFAGGSAGALKVTSQGPLPPAPWPGYHLSWVGNILSVLRPAASRHTARGAPDGCSPWRCPCPWTPDCTGGHPVTSLRLTGGSQLQGSSQRPHLVRHQQEWGLCPFHHHLGELLWGHAAGHLLALGCEWVVTGWATETRLNRAPCVFLQGRRLLWTVLWASLLKLSSSASPVWLSLGANGLAESGVSWCDASRASTVLGPRTSCVLPWGR